MKIIDKILTLGLLLFLKTEGVFAGHRPGHVSPVPVTSTPFPDLGKLIGQILVLIIILASILFFIQLIIGGIQWLTSGGDKVAATVARDRITAALTGLVIVLAAFAIVRIIEAAFGIRVLSGIRVPSQPSPFDTGLSIFD